MIAIENKKGFKCHWLVMIRMKRFVFLLWTLATSLLAMTRYLSNVIGKLEAGNKIKIMP
jgi:hypothetical protein